MDALFAATYVALWIFVLVLALMVILLYRQLGEMYLGAAESRSRDGLAIGSKAPAFALPDQAGRVITLPRTENTLLVFGSPTCGPCVSLMPHLVNFALQQRGKLGVYFVSAADAAANQRFGADHQVQFPILSQNETDTADQYGVRATPFAFYLDLGDRVRAKGVVNRLSQLQALVLRGQKDTQVRPDEGFRLEQPEELIREPTREV